MTGKENLPTQFSLDQFGNEVLTPRKLRPGTMARRQPEAPGLNSSFMTSQNMEWFVYAVFWMPDPNKPLVCLPCASAGKTRERFEGRKFISHSTSHQFMSPVTRDAPNTPPFERVILSEPLTIIPYPLEAHPKRPDYNLPPQDLSIQAERIFINQLALWLAKVKLQQPYRRFIYYVGGTHHFFILHFANLIAGSPFTIIYELLGEGGSTAYTSAAMQLRRVIIETERTGTPPSMPSVSLDKLINQRGRYCIKEIWKDISKIRRRGGVIVESIEPVGTAADIDRGFGGLYENIGAKAPRLAGVRQTTLKPGKRKK